MHKPKWIEVGQGDCRACGGYGINKSAPSWYTRSEAISRGYGCRACDHTGKRSIGFMDLRDASGR